MLKERSLSLDVTCTLEYSRRQERLRERGTVEDVVRVVGCNGPIFWMGRCFSHWIREFKEIVLYLTSLVRK